MKRIERDKQALQANSFPWLLRMPVHVYSAADGQVYQPAHGIPRHGASGVLAELDLPESSTRDQCVLKAPARLLSSI